MQKFAVCFLGLQSYPRPAFELLPKCGALKDLLSDIQQEIKNASHDSERSILVVCREASVVFFLGARKKTRRNTKPLPRVFKDVLLFFMTIYISAVRHIRPCRKHLPLTASSTNRLKLGIQGNV